MEGSPRIYKQCWYSWCLVLLSDSAAEVNALAVKYQREQERENVHDAFKSRDDRLAVDNKPTYTQGARVSFYILMSASTSHDDSRPTYLE